MHVELPPAQLAFTFEADAYVINQPLPIDSALQYRSMPKLEGHRYRDVANPDDMRDLLPWNQASPTTALGPPAYQEPAYHDPTSPPYNRPPYQPPGYPSYSSRSYIIARLLIACHKPATSGCIASAAGIFGRTLGIHLA